MDMRPSADDRKELRSIHMAKKLIYRSGLASGFAALVYSLSYGDGDLINDKYGFWGIFGMAISTRTR